MRGGLVTEAPALAAATVDIADIVWRIECRHLKPILWAEQLHPAFLSDRSPDVEVRVVYDASYWERGLPWIAPNTVPDEPVVSRAGQDTIVTTAYFQARIDRAFRRVDVRLASGFRVDGLMRSLTALLLLGRGGVLVRAARAVSGEGAVLLCGVPRGERPGLAAVGHDAAWFDGFIAVTPRNGRPVSFATPFHDEPPSVVRHAPAPAESLYLVRPDAPAEAKRVGRAVAATRLLPYLRIVDRDAAAIGRLIDVASELLRTLPCYEASSGVDPWIRSHAGAAS